MNQIIENIGARRLYYIMGKLLENVLFEAGIFIFGDFIINNLYVNEKFNNIKNTDNLNKFIL